ncbi:hypothetical protein [Halapricum desulfuricans]|uniref:hypothetical protein n=1 Tax=Halapricum desulfuricans TaxID=2841257 RepID=UPI001E3DCAE9|nr:hypothetical protein [Halapricum desulfuricans]
MTRAAPVWLIPAVTRAESVVSVFVSPRFLGTVALAVWIVALLLGHDVRQHRLQERLPTVVSFEAGPPENVRRQITCTDWYRATSGSIPTILTMSTP